MPNNIVTNHKKYGLNATRLPFFGNKADDAGTKIQFFGSKCKLPGWVGASFLISAPF